MNVTSENPRERIMAIYGIFRPKTQCPWLIFLHIPDNCYWITQTISNEMISAEKILKEKGNCLT